MSRDADGQERLWKSLGYGRKRAKQPTWRWWHDEKNDQWIISAPNALAEFQQRGRTVHYQGQAIITGKTQWEATWKALAYFYENVIPQLQPPEMSTKSDA